MSLTPSCAPWWLALRSSGPQEHRPPSGCKLPGVVVRSIDEGLDLCIDVALSDVECEAHAAELPRRRLQRAQRLEYLNGACRIAAEPGFAESSDGRWREALHMQRPSLSQRNLPRFRIPPALQSVAVATGSLWGGPKRLSPKG